MNNETTIGFGFRNNDVKKYADSGQVENTPIDLSE